MFFSLCRKHVTVKDGLTVAEVVELLEADVHLDEDENVEVQDVFIAPPPANELSDEDSGDEDTGGFLDNLPRNQLMSEAEAVLSNNIRIGGLHDFSGYSTKRKRKWIDGDLIDPLQKGSIFSTKCTEKYKDLTPVQIFELFIDEEVINLFVTETKKYAVLKNESNMNVSADEIKAFLGILILSGYNSLPGKKCYWNTKDDMKNILVSECMRRDRFLYINKYFHVGDNTEIDHRDRLFKLRPLINLLKTRFMKHWIMCEFLDYDESMVKYFGPHPCKQFIRGKPIRFGYKVWCLNTHYGYLVNFEIYQGKSTPVINPEYDEIFGKATAPLISFLDEIPDEKKHFPYHIVTDNLFTSLNLLKHLKERGYSGTGTMRKNRIPKDCSLPTNDQMKKMERGTFLSAIEKKDGIFVGKWMDNSVVTVASNSLGLQPVKQVKRFSRKEKKQIYVPQPALIGTYNRAMGGTDRMDQDISQYRISIRGKKWYWALLTWLLDTAINNAWHIYKLTGRKITKLDFRREIVLTYLTRYKTSIKSIGPTAMSSKKSSRVLDDIKYDRTDHLLGETAGKKRRRCANQGCKSVVTTMCIKCDVGLCLKCNIPFHTKQE